MTVTSFFFSSRRRHTSYIGDWSSDVCSSDLARSISSFVSLQITHVTRSSNCDSLWAVDEICQSDSVLCRSEERRVGKEGRSPCRSAPKENKTKTETRDTAQ